MTRRHIGTHATLHVALRDRLQAIATQAIEAKRMDPTENENLCDLIDAIDNDVQAAIALVKALREARMAS